MTLFGALVAVPQLEAAVKDQMAAWLPTYVAEVERQAGLAPGYIDPPRSYSSASENDLFPEEQTTAILVVSPGTDGTPERVNDPNDAGAIVYASWFQVSVVAAVVSITEVDARALAGYYAAAIRGVMVQRPSVDGFASGSIWVGEEIFGNPETQRDRTRAAAVVHFRVRVEALVTALAGPLASDIPPDDPYDAWPEPPTIEDQPTAAYGNVPGAIDGDV